MDISRTIDYYLRDSVCAALNRIACSGVCSSKDKMILLELEPYIMLCISKDLGVSVGSLRAESCILSVQSFRLAYAQFKHDYLSEGTAVKWCPDIENMFNHIDLAHPAILYGDKEYSELLNRVNRVNPVINTDHLIDEEENRLDFIKSVVKLTLLISAVILVLWGSL